MSDYKLTDKKLKNKILYLGFSNYLTEVYFLVNLLEKQIKFCELELDHLNNNKPFWFQRKKFKEYNIKVRELQDKINYYYDCISIQSSYIDEIKNIKF